MPLQRAAEEGFSHANCCSDFTLRHSFVEQKLQPFPQFLHEWSRLPQLSHLATKAQPE
jgi:hypothetical protein